MNNLLVIGAGVNQVSIIQQAKKMGCFVHVVSPEGDYPGIKLADAWLCADIFSRDQIVEYAMHKDIQGVISDQSDMAAPIVAYVAEQLGLPTFGYKNSLIFTDKHLMRQLYEELGLPVPKYHTVKSFDDVEYAANDIGFPVVVKPVDSFSSRGITRVDTSDELQSAYLSAVENSREGLVVIEKFIDGPQYFSQGFVSEYKYNLFAFSDRYYYDLDDVFIPYTNAFPAIISDELKNRMKDMMAMIIDHCKPRFGHIWTEWIIDKDTDELYIVEMAIRGAGANVTTEIIPRAYGVDTQPYLINAALGRDDGSFAQKIIEPQKASAFYSFLLPKGVVQSVSGLDKIAGIPGVVKAELKEVAVGDCIEKCTDKNSRYGLIVVEGESREHLDSIWRELQRTIDIRVLTDNGLFEGPIWT